MQHQVSERTLTVGYMNPQTPPFFVAALLRKCFSPTPVMRQVAFLVRVGGNGNKDIQRSWHVSETIASHSTYYTIWKGSMAIATPKFGGKQWPGGHDKPTRMGVAIAIDPFQGVYVRSISQNDGTPMSGWSQYLTVLQNMIWPNLS